MVSQGRITQGNVRPNGTGGGTASGPGGDDSDFIRRNLRVSDLTAHVKSAVSEDRAETTACVDLESNGDIGCSPYYLVPPTLRQFVTKSLHITRSDKIAWPGMDRVPLKSEKKLRLPFYPRKGKRVNSGLESLDAADGPQWRQGRLA